MSSSSTTAPRAVRGVLFDFDGTLTRPGHLDFAAIRRAIGCPPGGSLLAYLDGIEEPVERRRAAETLDRFEIEAARRSQEDPEAGTVVAFCREHGMRTAIVTRNSRRSILASFDHFTGISAADFDVILTRDDGVEVKPAPDGILRICAQWGLEPSETLLVGDFLYDIEAGRRAGSRTVFYDSDPERSFNLPSSDHIIDRLGALIAVLDLYRPLPAGKLPSSLLGTLLSGIGGVTAPGDAGLLIGPAVGEDVAVIAPPAAEVVGECLPGAALVVTSDPITFVAEDFGHYLVTVNANDIATAGAVPRWLVATLLVPPGSLGIELSGHFENLSEACRRSGVVLCGGHTEVTDAVSRPVASGTLIGTVDPGELIRKDSMRNGDLILLSKGIAVEGTVILATEYADLLRERGIPEQELATAAGMKEWMSILREARIAATSGSASAMHDVTEGGIATALRELSTAGGHRLRVDLERIPILPQTRAFCECLELDPLGLIASGNLLICAREEGAGELLARLRAASIEVTSIGVVLERGEGVEAMREGRPVPLPDFPVDEIARLASARAGRGGGE